MIPPYDSTVTSLDWRDWGIIRPIDDQGLCGCCYVFSTAHSLESVNGIRTGEVLEVSEQHGVDCCDVDGCNGCNGGDMRILTKWHKTAGNYALADYAYTSGDSGDAGTCSTSGLTALDTTKLAVEGTNWVTNSDSKAKADFLKGLRD